MGISLVTQKNVVPLQPNWKDAGVVDRAALEMR